LIFASYIYLYIIRWLNSNQSRCSNFNFKKSSSPDILIVKHGLYKFQENWLCNIDCTSRF